MAVGLFFSGGSVHAETDATENQNFIKHLEKMTNKEKEKYFDEQTKRINNSYEVNEVFSEKDEKIIREAVKFEQNKIGPYWSDNNWTFFGSKASSSLDMSGNVAGDVYLDVGFINHNLSVNANVASYNDPADEARIRVNYVGYGIIGNSGIGKTNDFWLDTGWVKSSTAILQDSRNFSGYELYSTVNVYGEIKNDKGTMVIPGVAE